MNPSQYPEVQAYPAIVKILKDNVDMWFKDVKTMLKQPLCESDGGCNFAAANFICDIISGISSVLYKPNKGIEKDRFEELMKNYYPWATEGRDPEEGYRIIYKWMRHSITHRLGFFLPAQKTPPAGEPVIIAKSKHPLNFKQIKELEDLSKLSAFDQTIVDTKRWPRYEVRVEGLYRGLHKMLKNLFKDKQQMQNTNSFWENIFIDQK